MGSMGDTVVQDAGVQVVRSEGSMEHTPEQDVMAQVVLPEYHLSLSAPRKEPSIIFRFCWRAVEQPLSRVVSCPYRAPDMGGGN